MAWTMAGSTPLATTHTPTPTDRAQHTSRRGVLAGKVPGLVAAEKTGGLDLGGRAPGELLVKVDDALHAEGIGGGTNSLRNPNRQPVSCRVIRRVPSCRPFPLLRPFRLVLCRRRRLVDQSLPRRPPSTTIPPSQSRILRINRCDVPWARQPVIQVSNRPAPRTAVMHQPWGG